MLRTVAGFAVLFSSLALTAQSGPATSGSATSNPDWHNSPGLTTIILPPFHDACPVAMHASQGTWDHTIRIRNGERDLVQPFGQRISLTLKASDSERIVSATVRVRGWNGKHRIVSTPTASDQEWNAVTTLTVSFVEENDGSVSGDLRINGFTGVYSIQLLSMTYADGRIWRLSETNACRVQPDPLMLITDRR